jgi:DMSO/TMAO reductase YedYZ molybdopterin-dependent catalytic subunit
MNGQALPPGNGFPVRLIVPGWVGVSNIKWVGQLQVSREPLYSYWNTTSYILEGADYPTPIPLTHQAVKGSTGTPSGPKHAEDWAVAVWRGAS